MSCPTCAAHQQTIVMLADQVDWLRAQLGSTALALASSGNAPIPQVAELPSSTVVDKSLWLDEDAEDIEALVAGGALSTEEAEQALAAVQAQNTHIELVR